MNKIEKYLLEKEKLLHDTFKGQKPIFELFLFEHPEKELVYPTGNRSGMPDFGASMTAGFFYDMEDAVQAMHLNAGDIHEIVYDAGFVICRFPGLYDCVGSDRRIYFVYDKERQEYVEKEEPAIFSHVGL